MDGFINGQLFDDLFLEDTDGPKLNQLPQMVEAFDLYKSKFCKICDELITFALKEAESRDSEKSMFSSAVNKAKEADKAQGVKLINDFLAYKKKVGTTLKHFVNFYKLSCFYFRKSAICDTLSQAQQTIFKLKSRVYSQVLTEMSQISDARVIDQKISELQEELNNVWDTLMGYELQLAEQLEVWFK